MIANRKITRWKTLFVLAFLCLLSAAVSAQIKSIDSLNRLIQESGSDSQRLSLLSAKSKLYSEINLDSSILAGREAISIARRINKKMAIAKNLMMVASDLFFKGEYDSGRKLLEESAPLTRELHDTALMTTMASTFGSMYGMQGKYDSSILYFFQTVDFSRAIRDTSRLANAYRNLATSYQMESRFSEALKYLQIALGLSEAQKDARNQAYLLFNLGMVYNGIFDFERAEQNWLKSIDLAKQLGIKNVELYASSNLASLYIDQDRYQKGYELAQQAAKLAVENGDLGMEATNTSRMAVGLQGLGKPEEALQKSREAIALAGKSNQNFNLYQTNKACGDILIDQKNYKDAVTCFERAFAAMKGSDLFDSQFADGYKALSTAYEKVGRYKEALVAYQAGTKISDSIVSKENVRKTTESALNYDFEKKQQASKLLQERDQQAAKNKQKILFGGLIFTLLLAVAAWYAFTTKRKANVLLEDQKAALQTALAELKDTQAQLIESEKMASLGELTAGIAHEIQNPLNFVNNFSEVSVELLDELKIAVAAGNTQEVTEISGDLASNLTKILHHGKRADAIVKGMLQHSRSSSDQKELTDLNALCDEYLRLSYHGLRAKNKSFNATLNTDFDPSLGKTAVVPQDIGRVVLNLLTNAFYAVDEKQKKGSPGYLPSVWISTRKTGQTVIISVKDNGNGIPEKVKDKMFQPFFTTKPTGQGTGLGLSLSYDIIKAHGGEIMVESREGVGTEFILRLPFQPELPEDTGKPVL